jgi:hypothetical protein
MPRGKCWATAKSTYKQGTVMTNIPIVKLVDPAEVPAWTGLSEQVLLAMADIAMRPGEGLLAMSVQPRGWPCCSRS